MKALLLIVALCLLTGVASATAYTTTGCTSGNFQTVSVWNDGTSCGHGSYPHSGDSCTINGGVVVTIPLGETDTIGTDALNNVACLVTGANSLLTINGKLISLGNISLTSGGSLSGTNPYISLGSLSGQQYKVDATNSASPASSITFTGGTWAPPQMVEVRDLAITSNVATFTTDTNTYTSGGGQVIYYNINRPSTITSGTCTSSSATSTTVVCPITHANLVNQPVTGTLALGPAGNIDQTNGTVFPLTVNISGMKFLDCGTTSNVKGCIYEANNLTLTSNYFQGPGDVVWYGINNGDDFQIINNHFGIGLNNQGSGYAIVASEYGTTVAAVATPRQIAGNMFYCTAQTACQVQVGAQLSNIHDNYFMSANAIAITGGYGNIYQNNLLSVNNFTSIPVATVAADGTNATWTVTNSVKNTQQVAITNCTNSALNTLLNQPVYVNSATGSLFKTPTTQSFSTVTNETCVLQAPIENGNFNLSVVPGSGAQVLGGGLIENPQGIVNKTHGFREAVPINQPTITFCNAVAGVPGTLTLTLASAGYPINLYAGLNFFLYGPSTSPFNCQGLYNQAYQLSSWNSTAKTLTFTGNTVAITTSGTVADTGTAEIFVGPLLISGFITDGDTGLYSQPFTDLMSSSRPHYSEYMLSINGMSNMDNVDQSYQTDGMILHNTIDNCLAGSTSGVSAISCALRMENWASPTKYVNNTANLTTRVTSTIGGNQVGTPVSQYFGTVSMSGCVFNVASTLGIASPTLTITSCSNSITTSPYPDAPGLTCIGLQKNSWFNNVPSMVYPAWNSTGVAVIVKPDVTPPPTTNVTETGGTCYAGMISDYNYLYGLIPINPLSGPAGQVWNPAGTTGNISGWMYYNSSPWYRGQCTETQTGATTNTATCFNGSVSTLPAGTQVGDVALDSSAQANAALVTAVNNTTGVITTTPVGTSGCPPNCNSNGTGSTTFTNAHTLTIEPAFINTMYGTTGFEGNSVYGQNPNYRDNSCTTSTFDTQNGGPGTWQHARDEFAKVLGYDPLAVDGSAATYNPVFSYANWARYLRACFTPMNGTLKNAAIDHKDVGGVSVYPAAMN